MKLGFSRLDDHIRSLKQFQEMYQKYVIEPKRKIGSPIQVQMQNQIDLACLDLHNDFQQIKQDYNQLMLSAQQYLDTLIKYRTIIKGFEFVNHDQLGSTEILKELERMA